MSPSDTPLIVHIIYRLDYGGLENGLVNLINHMSTSRFRHAIVCLAGFGEFRHRISCDGVEVYSLEKRPGKDPMAYLRLWRLLRRLRPTIVHTRNVGTVDAQWVALLAGVRHRVHGEHGWEVGDLMGRNPKFIRIRRFCRPVIQRYVAMSGDIENWLKSTIGIADERISQLYNGVDAKKFSSEGAVPRDLPWAGQASSSQVFVFGTVGRLDPVKGQSQLLEAFAKLVEQFAFQRHKLRLIVAGSGPLADELRLRVEALGIGDLVWLPGSRDDVADLMRSMDVFVLPSLNEGISNTILEAMASSLPVVAARVGGNPELVLPDQTGVLYKQSDVAELRAAMAGYFVEPQRAVRHGTAGRARVLAGFSLDAMVRNYCDLYQRVLGE